MRKYRGYIAAGLLIGVLTVSGCASNSMEAPVVDVMDEAGVEQTDIINTDSIANYPVNNIFDVEKQDISDPSDVPTEITGSGLPDGTDLERDQAASDTETKQVVAGERNQATTEKKAVSATEAATIKAVQPITEAPTTKPIQPTTEARTATTTESRSQSVTANSSQSATEAPKSIQPTTEASSTLQVTTEKNVQPSTEATRFSQASASKSVQVATEATTAKAEQATTEAPRAVQPTTEATTAKTTQPTTEAPKTSATTEATTEASTEAVHTHTWVAVYKTVKHPEEGHWEQVYAGELEHPIVEGHTICSNPGCKFDYTATGTNIGDHQCADGTWGSNYHNENVVVGYWTETFYDDVWVVDKAAYTEQVVDYYKCSGCGEKKTE